MTSLKSARASQNLLAGMSYSNLLRIRNLSQEGKQQETEQIKQKLEALRAATKPAQMQSSEFLEALAAVDTANPDEFQDFLNATQIQPHDKLPDYIPIGSHDGVQYFIQVSDMSIPQDWSTTGGQELDEESVARETQLLGPPSPDPDSIRPPPSPFPTIDRTSMNVYGLPPRSVGSSAGTPPRSVGSSAGTRSDFGELIKEEDSEVYPGMSLLRSQRTSLLDLKYGFGIGRLQHKMPNASQPEDTGFYVICNALDKSIWAAFDFEPYGETGEVKSVRPEYNDPYGQLPGDKQNLVVGVQRLFSKDWMAERPFSLDRGDPFTSSASRPIATRLTAKPAYLDEVVNAIKRYRGSTAKQQIGEGQSRFNPMDPRYD